MPRAEARAQLQAAVDLYYSHVGEIKDYLLSRGVTGDVARRFRLGYVHDPLPGHERMGGRLAIPYLTPSGPVAIRFRSVDPNESGPKYLSTVGDIPRLYNPGALLTPSPYMVITEGELDAITVDALCGIPCVGVPGAQHWQPVWGRLFDGYDRILVVADGDDAGRSMARKVSEDLPWATVVQLPDGEDSNSVVLSEGPEGLKLRLGVD